jgi:H+/gluconate symporter-like permease
LWRRLCWRPCCWDAAGKHPRSIDKGIGDLLGSLIVIVCLGAVFGKLIADSGAAQRIASYLIGVFGSARMPVALTLTGFVAGIPLYYNVGFVLLVPLVFSLVYQSGRPAVALAIPLLAGRLRMASCRRILRRPRWWRSSTPIWAARCSTA